MGFSRQECWSELSCPPSGDLSDPGIKPASLTSSHWQVGSLPPEPPGINNHLYFWTPANSCLKLCFFVCLVFSKYKKLSQILPGPPHRSCGLFSPYSFWCGISILLLLSWVLTPHSLPISFLPSFKTVCPATLDPHNLGFPFPLNKLFL